MGLVIGARAKRYSSAEVKTPVARMVLLMQFPMEVLVLLLWLVSSGSWLSSTSADSMFPLSASVATRDERRGRHQRRTLTQDSEEWLLTATVMAFQLTRHA